MPFEKIRILSRVEDDNLGCSDEQIKSVEIKLGIDFPNGLRNYYREFGNHKRKISLYNDMINLNELDVDKEGFLTFYRGSQDGVRWGITKDKKGSKLVYHRLDKWIKDNNQIEKTILGIGLRNALTSLPFFAFRWNIEETEEKKVHANFKRVEAGFNLWNSNFFQNQPNEIVGLTKSEGQINLSIAANNKKDFNRIKSIFKDDWYSHENQLKKLVARNKNEASS